VSRRWDVYVRPWAIRTYGSVVSFFPKTFRFSNANGMGSSIPNHGQMNTTLYTRSRHDDNHISLDTCTHKKIQGGESKTTNEPAKYGKSPSRKGSPC
jgi:hypothetical protein